jgi:hypothetical protein
MVPAWARVVPVMNLRTSVAKEDDREGSGHWNMLLLGEGVNQVSIQVRRIACRSGKKEGGKEEDGWGRGWSGQLCSMNTNGYKRISKCAEAEEIRVKSYGNKND